MTQRRKTNSYWFTAFPAPLLWVLRDDLGLTGTKYGCGIAQCGACTVHVDGEPMRSCSTAGRRRRRHARSTTIEGLGATAAHPVQKAWVELDVPQCGYCQSGQIMAAAALLQRTPQARPTPTSTRAMSGNICRCGTYQRIRAAIHAAATALA